MSKKKRSKEMFTKEQVKEFAKRLNEAIENSPYKNNVEVAIKIPRALKYSYYPVHLIILALVVQGLSWIHLSWIH